MRWSKLPSPLTRGNRRSSVDERRDFRASEALSEKKELFLRFRYTAAASPKAVDRARVRGCRRDGLGLRRPPVGQGDDKVMFDAFSIIIEGNHIRRGESIERGEGVITRKRGVEKCKERVNESTSVYGMSYLETRHRSGHMSTEPERRPKAVTLFEKLEMRF